MNSKRAFTLIELLVVIAIIAVLAALFFPNIYVVNALHPAKTVMLAEISALSPYSWHELKRPFSKENAPFPDAKNMICFVDGHVVNVAIEDLAASV